MSTNEPAEDRKAESNTTNSDGDIPATEVDSEVEDIIRQKAGNQCEQCGEEESLQIYHTGDDGSFSLSALELLCEVCYSEGHTKQTLTPPMVLQYFDEIELPFLTSSMIAQEFDVTTETARKKLSSLVDDDELHRHELDGRRTLFFRPDFQAGNELLDGLREVIDLTDLDTAALQAFARQPFKIIPRAEDQEYYVVVPRFLPFSMGHLHEQDDAWQTFIVNRYVSWFSELPDAIGDKITLHQRYDKAVIDDDLLEFSSEHEREDAWEDFDGEDGPLEEKVGDKQVRIQSGKEFDVMASIIDGGNLPFQPAPIDSDHLRPEPTSISLRDYQREAWDRFEEYGQVGVFWPPGVGKTFIGMYAGDRIKGKKLVVVPSTILREQWEDRIEEHTRAPDEWTVQTYQYLTHSQENLQEHQGEDSPMLTIYDEAHFVPANSFSQLAMIDTEYRIGLSASPYREDGREEFIFALTGMPVGVDWQKLAQHGIVDYPEAFVYLYKTQRQKREGLISLIKEKPGKGIIFCDSLEEGEKLSEELGVPFVNGNTPAESRVNMVRNNRITILSRVGDEGMSIPDLNWTVEYSFLGSSRRQELQRQGRLMHSDHSEDEGSEIADHSNQHILLMTDKEADRHGGRLMSLQEKGIEIQYERKA